MSKVSVQFRRVIRQTSVYNPNPETGRRQQHPKAPPSSPPPPVETIAIYFDVSKNHFLAFFFGSFTIYESIVLPVFELYVSGILLYVLFCDLLLFFNCGNIHII